MDKTYIQNTRYKLQKRVRKLNSIDVENFHAFLSIFWIFINDHPIFGSIFNDLSLLNPECEETANKIIKGQRLFGENERETTAISYFVVKKCLESTDRHTETNIGQIFKISGSTDEFLETFKSFFIEPLYEYIDEQLDDQRAILYLLKKYKHKCEWFKYESLLKLWQDNTGRGEKVLSLHLYDYLHDQGLDFMIDSWSIEGKPDLISAQKSDEPFIADVKVFSDNNKKPYLIKGFNQIYQYTKTFNESFGYLIIFNTTTDELSFALSEQEQNIPFVIHNGKTIFILTIDIGKIDKTASEKGKLKTIEITEKELINKVSDEK
jgi:hypothetical protein